MELVTPRRHAISHLLKPESDFDEILNGGRSGRERRENRNVRARNRIHPVSSSYYLYTKISEGGSL
jgi:hypothetical protein